MVILGSNGDVLSRKGTWFAWRPVVTECGRLVWLERLNYWYELRPANSMMFGPYPMEMPAACYSRINK